MTLKSLTAVLAETLEDVSPDRLDLAAEKIGQSTDVLGSLEKGVGSVYMATARGQWLLSALKDSHDIGPADLSASLYALAAARRRQVNASKVELLWTGPTSRFVPVRRNEQALCEIVQSAKNRLLIVTYVIYKTPVVFDAIKAALARGVEVAFLLEPPQEYGGSVTIDNFALVRKEFPGAKCYYWKSEEPSGAVHAKCAIADSARALVTSANLTGKAMEENMELGVILNDHDVVGRLREHFDALMAERVVVQVV